MNSLIFIGLGVLQYTAGLQYLSLSGDIDVDTLEYSLGAGHKLIRNSALQLPDLELSDLTSCHLCHQQQPLITDAGEERAATLTRDKDKVGISCGLHQQLISMFCMNGISCQGQFLGECLKTTGLFF